MPHRSEITADDIRGLNAAWAVVNVPGTKLALARGTIVAFVRDTGHAAKPVDRVARYVETGVSAFLRRAGGTA